MSNIINIYEELISKLQANTELTTIINNRIYTHIPQDTSFPSVRLNITENNISTFTEQDYKYNLLVQVFSEELTPRECLEIKNLIINILNRQENNFTNINYIQQTGNNNYFQDKENSIWQANLQFQLYSE